MCLNDGAPVEPALCDQEAMPAADGKAKSFIYSLWGEFLSGELLGEF